MVYQLCNLKYLQWFAVVEKNEVYGIRWMNTIASYVCLKNVKKSSIVRDISKNKTLITKMVNTTLFYPSASFADDIL